MTKSYAWACGMLLKGSIRLGLPTVSYLRDAVFALFGVSAFRFFFFII